jgi:hypothetical protein
VAFARVQAVAHPPQFASVVSGVSQPFAALASQLPKPELQVPMAQVPDAQLALALARVQVVPQPPQFETVVSGASQPFAALASQLPKPGLQAPRAQLPVAQLEAAFDITQGVPHAPQSVAVVSGASQPLTAPRSQLPKPELQPSSVQLPAEQLAVAWARVHAAPHAPQLASVSSEVSQPLAAIESQSAKPALQEAVSQFPAAQVGVASARVQAVPHAPQLVSVVRVDSQPLDSFRSQLPKLELHVVSAQVPVAHVEAPLGREHAVPQEPQLASVVSGVSQPLEATRSQSPKPASHETTRQIEPLQLAPAFGGSHTVPQAPQFASPSSEVSQPLEATRSQSA